jgi:hypothetical protein
LDAPALAHLLARADRMRPQSASPEHETPDTHDGFARALPHERWLAQQHEVQDALPLAVASMRALGLAQDGIPTDSYWLMLNPVHIHIARDHLVLTDQRQLDVTEAESMALFAAAAPYFDEAGHTLLYGGAHLWFMRADAWRTLQTASPDAACGHNIDIWMPQGDGARDWRKLQNEVQMLWHAHPVNLHRADRGLPPVNSLWLWGGADSAHAAPHDTYRNVFNCNTPLTALCGPASSQLRAANAAELLQNANAPCLLVLDDLIAAALAEDWSAWLQQWQMLDCTWLMPLHQALGKAQLPQLRLIMSDGARCRTFHSTRWGAAKFWIKPSFKRLLP